MVNKLIIININNILRSVWRGREVINNIIYNFHKYQMLIYGHIKKYNRVIHNFTCKTLKAVSTSSKFDSINLYVLSVEKWKRRDLINVYRISIFIQHFPLLQASSSRSCHNVNKTKNIVIQWERDMWGAHSPFTTISMHLARKIHSLYVICNKIFML